MFPQIKILTQLEHWIKLLDDQNILPCKKVATNPIRKKNTWNKKHTSLSNIPLNELVKKKIAYKTVAHFTPYICLG